MSKKVTLLCILDGFGISDKKEGNAIALAKRPHLDKIFNEFHMVKGNAAGEDVGLPKGQMGNSEVGHLNIGAGRIVYQDLTRISKSIDDNSFFDNGKLLEAIKHVKNNNSSLHIMGLLSDGGVHTHINHLFALIEFAKRNNVKNVYIHPFLDGRDTAPNSGKDFLNELENKIKEIGVGNVATICGRYYAMDRDKNYDRTRLAYDLLTKNEGEKFDTVLDAINDSYEKKLFDEFVKPKVIGDGAMIKDNDAVIFFNFRPDRARQLTRCFVDDEFTYFDRKKLNNLVFVAMTEYDVTIKNKLVAFEEKDIRNHIGEVVAKAGFRQLRTAETEKYAHVTFFFNGGKEAPMENEDRILVPSPKEVPTYDLKPEMSCFEVCDNVLNAIDSDKYDFIVVNFANPDMVGHTGNLDATIKAIECVDECVGKIFDKIVSKESNMLIIADHGNAELMVNDDGDVVTSHTNNPVPFCLITKEKYRIKENGKLSDIAPTLLDIMNIEKPIEMTGQSLLVK